MDRDPEYSETGIAEAEIESPLKILVLVRETVNHWAQYYVRALRTRFYVITAGPMLNSEHYEPLQQNNAFIQPFINDIKTDTDMVSDILRQLPKDWKPDLVLAIQSGTVQYWDIATLPCVTAYISVDSWHDPNELDYARVYDFVFVAQKAFINYFEVAGCRNVYWLPLACDPYYHRPRIPEADLDFIFVGTLKYKVNRERRARIQRLRDQQYKIDVFSDIGPEEMSRAYSSCRLGFNSSIAQDMNMRVFEVMAMGCPLFTNRDAEANGLLDLFEEDHHFIGYSDEDLLRQASQYLNNATARLRIATDAYNLVRARHTYEHRVVELVEIIAGYKADFLHTFCQQRAKFSWPHLVHTVRPGTMRLLDLNLNLAAYSIALRKRGVQVLVGASSNLDAIHQSRRFYNEMLHWPAATMPEDDTHRFDMVVIGAFPSYFGDFESTLTYASSQLRTAGDLVLVVTPENADACLQMFNSSKNAEVKSELDICTLHHFDCLQYVPPVPALDMPGFIKFRKFDQHKIALAHTWYEQFPGGSHAGSVD